LLTDLWLQRFLLTPLSLPHADTNSYTRFDSVMNKIDARN
jgi:hypothetical protein